MRALVQDKYALRDLHREIDLIDRKLNHTMKHESFETEEERAAAVRKLTVRRDQHVVLAQSLIDLGIEYHPSEVPASLRTPEQIAALEADTQATPDAVAQAEVLDQDATVARPDPTDFGAMVRRLERENELASSPLAAWKDDLAAYRRRRQKAQSA